MLRRSLSFLVAGVLVATAVPATAVAGDDPSAGEWPITTQATDLSGMPRGVRWVRTNPMLVGALSVSMGTPPSSIVAEYFSEFGASAVMLWQDGPGEVGGWQQGRPQPFVTWVREDGTSAVWNGFAFESTGEVIGGLAADAPGRIGYQVGDEPGSITALEHIADGIEAVRTADPGALVYTNLSIYSAAADAVLGHWVSSVDADLLMSSDYFFDDLHYSALERYRAAALAKGVPYWQYLNAYIGAESAFALQHTESDLRWQAMLGLVYGYTGHVWFIYQAADGDQHPTATMYGGSALVDGVGDWGAAKRPQWGWVAAINEELANLGPTMTQLTSTDVRLVVADHPSAIRPLGTRGWTPGAGGDPYLTALGPAPGELPMDVPVGFFRDAAGERYVMVQNGRHTHSLGASEAPLPGAEEPGRVRLEFDFTGAPFTVDRNRLEYLDPVDGKVKSLPLVEIPEPPPAEPPAPGTEPVPPPPSERRYAEVTLPPGGVLLFKYADTIPFRLGPVQDGVGVVDVGQGEWHLRDRDGVRSFYFGNPGDVPFMGDWDCDGIDTPGLYRQSDGFVYLRNSNTAGIADVRFFFGNPGDVPLAGDFDGDGCDTVSIYRPGEGRIYVIDRLGANDGGLGEAEREFYFGNPGDRPFVGDFDGDGVDTVGLHRVTTGLVYLRNENAAGPADLQFYFGNPSDVIVSGDWEGDGSDSVGLFRRAEARFYLSFANASGGADVDFLFGDSAFSPISGHF